jgi:hypothetical protein
VGASDLTAWGGSQTANRCYRGGLTASGKNPRERELPIVVWAWKPHREHHPAERFLNH